MKFTKYVHTVSTIFFHISVNIAPSINIFCCKAFMKVVKYHANNCHTLLIFETLFSVSVTSLYMAIHKPITPPTTRTIGFAARNVSAAVNAFITVIHPVIAAQVPLKSGITTKRLAHKAVIAPTVMTIFFVSSGFASAHFKVS